MGGRDQNIVYLGLRPVGMAGLFGVNLGISALHFSDVWSGQPAALVILFFSPGHCGSFGPGGLCLFGYLWHAFFSRFGARRFSGCPYFNLNGGLSDIFLGVGLFGSQKGGSVQPATGILGGALCLGL